MKLQSSVFAIAMAFALACSGSKTSDVAADNRTDVGGLDGDADTDADADSDTDADTDRDTADSGKRFPSGG